MRERMLAGLDYQAWDPEIQADAERRKDLQHRINALHPAQAEERRALFTEMLGTFGEGADVRPPFYCDLGYQTHVGARSFINYGMQCADVARITIGEDVLIGPSVKLLTPTHPIDPVTRRAGWEGGRPITIGDGVWIGGGVTVCPGVTIGENTVVGAGSVVVRDLPPNVVAVGNPARVVREID
ncbi:maltose O-acetyltransferase [Sediminihabitans luteus]|uniref:Maltose O-acetyltransferase n=2 Tax=Sediminihabitans luteus TaxID=1138585 RepID=A0A2M9D143_9CELL|nr:sugar O-acetyltransferase [Sediminihabitans luteus]PJJ77880.1 maltose O-acetyltransferase [Sediminihabitans luteus]GII99762.1 maltose O-acetyltransferase [Sediminihabitans luteus]